MKDPLFANKIAGAALASLLLFFGLPQLTKALFGGEEHHRPGEKLKLAYPIDYETEAGSDNKAEAEPDLGTLLANAKPAAGERRTALCKSCHNFEKGGPNQTGPNLYGVVGRPVASHPGFTYTSALKAFGGEWTYERLDKFLADSQTLVPGTAMTQHWPKADQRADIIAYLSTLSDNPVPFPEPKAPAASEEGAGTAADDEGDKGDEAATGETVEKPQENPTATAAGNSTTGDEQEKENEPESPAAPKGPTE